MKTLDVGQIDLNNCISVAQSEPIVLTRAGQPVALVVGVNGMDEEQIELGASAEFWKLVQARRAQATISRQELETWISAD
jgi:antitoxin (DNA-binding transcriptional repressor) of toxin-antitoxin stability system